MAVSPPKTMEERLAELGRRIDGLGASAQAGTDETAEQSAAADVAKDTDVLVDAVMAELDDWDVRLERLQLEAATDAGSGRDQAESAIAELRRRRIALGARLGEMRSASGEAWREDTKHPQAAWNALERARPGRYRRGRGPGRGA